MASKNQMNKQLITKKTFNYEKGACTLNFTLKIDVKTELKDFKECLVEAQKDIDNILETL